MGGERWERVKREAPMVLEGVNDSVPPQVLEQAEPRNKGGMVEHEDCRRASRTFREAVWVLSVFRT